jgi:hypothetical protein
MCIPGHRNNAWHIISPSSLFGHSRPSKQIIKECKRKKKAGHIAYGSLSQAIGTRLRLAVGDEHWKMACQIHKRLERGHANSLKKARGGHHQKGEEKDDADGTDGGQGKNKDSSVEKKVSFSLSSTVAASTRAGDGDDTVAKEPVKHVSSPFEAAQRALAAQVEACNRASAQMGHAPQTQQQGQEAQQQQAIGFPPAPEAQPLQGPAAAAAWEGRTPSASCHSGESSESSC